MKNNLVRLSRKDIEDKYLNQPVLINETWYIIRDTHTHMPLHMLTNEEVDLYKLHPDNIDGIQIAGVDGNDMYLMWIYFNLDVGWCAYGYDVCINEEKEENQL